ncbi:MAG: hypothetical protein AB1742_07455 [bacterium]
MKTLRTVFVVLALAAAGCGGKQDPVRSLGNFPFGTEKIKSFGIDVRDDGAELYLANNVRKEIVVLDPNTLGAVKIFPVTDPPRYVRYVPAKKWLLVSHDKRGDTNQLFTVLDMDAGQKLFEIELNQGLSTSVQGLGSKTFAYAPAQDKVYVANSKLNLSVIDFSVAATATVSAISNSKFGSAALLGTAVNSAETLLYASDNVNSKIYVLDVVATGTTVTYSPITTSNCTELTHLALDETRSRLYGSCAKSNAIISVDYTPGRTGQCMNLAVGSSPGNMVISSDDNYLFVSNHEGDSVSMVDLSTFSVVNTFAAGDYPAGVVQYSPYIYVTNVLDSSVSKIAYSASTASAEPTVLDRSLVFAANPAGNYEIYFMQTSGACAVQLTTNGQHNFQPAWDSGKSKLIFVRGGSEADTSSYDIYVYDVSAKTYTNITNNSYMDAEPSIALSEFVTGTVKDRILFTTNRDGNKEIYSMKTDGSEATNLTNNSADDFMPSWFIFEDIVSFPSVSTQKILFVSNRNGNYELYIMDSDGTNQTRLTTTTTVQEMYPVHTTNSSSAEIVYVQSTSTDPLHSSTDVYKGTLTFTTDTVAETITVNGITGSAVFGSQTGFMDTYPSWIDSSTVLFLSGRDGTTEVYKYNGSAATRLTDNAYTEATPSATKK